VQRPGPSRPHSGGIQVLVAGCHPPNDCHYISGNLKAQRRVALLKRLMSQLGLEPERLRLEWISAAEGDKFARVIREMVADIKRMGPSPLGKVEALVAGDE
jgi:F420-non-reducing hydrogenase iron-sulfur subunit